MYALLPYAVMYEPYTWAHVLTQVQLLLFSGLAFFVLLPYLKRTLTITLDSDWVWRRLLPASWQRMATGFDAAKRGLGGQGVRAGAGLLAVARRYAGVDARLARTWSTRAMALSVLVLLLGYMVLYYL